MIWASVSIKYSRNTFADHDENCSLSTVNQNICRQRIVGVKQSFCSSLTSGEQGINNKKLLDCGKVKQRMQKLRSFVLLTSNKSYFDRGRGIIWFHGP